MTDDELIFTISITLTQKDPKTVKIARIFIRSVLLTNLALLSPLTLADKISGIHPLLSDSFSIGIGGFSADHEVKAKYGIDGSGDQLNFKRDLGMKNDKTIPAANITWRPFNNHQIQFEYFGWSDDADFAITKEIDWGDETFPINANITTKEDFDVYRFFYGYNFFKEDNYELGAGIGFHIADLELSISESSIGSATASGTAPLPNIGIYGAYAFTDKWLVMGRADWLDMSIDEYEGPMTNASVSLQYQAFDNFGLGVLYRYVDFEIEKDQKILDWSANMTFDGPSVFVTANF